MRATLLWLFPFLCFSLVAAWTKEDHEIFRLRDEVSAHEGFNVTFYDMLGVRPSATLDEINKAYRKKSRQLHPDKARQSFIASYPIKNKGKTSGKKGKPGVRVTKGPSQKEIAAFNKQASERFARLGVVANILRGPNRERYDHFLRNGFPKWRGTGYYYARFRPGLVSVLLGLFVFGGLVQYGAMYLGWKRQRDFVERYIRHARRMAWGDDTGIAGIGNVLTGEPAPQVQSFESTQPDDGTNTPMNRRQKRQQAKEERKGKSSKATRAGRSSGISTPQEAEPISGPRGAKKRVVAENGKVLIVDSVGNVFLEDETEDGETHEYLLDVDEIAKPTLYDTVIWRIPVWCYRKSIARLAGRSQAVDTSPTILTPPESDDEKEDVVSQSSIAANASAELKRRKNKTIVK